MIVFHPRARRLFVFLGFGLFTAAASPLHGQAAHNFATRPSRDIQTQASRDVLVQMRQTSRAVATDRSSSPPLLAHFPERYRLVAQNEAMRSRYWVNYVSASQDRAAEVDRLVAQLQGLMAARGDAPPADYVADLHYDLDLMRRAAETSNPFERAGLLAIVEGSMETRVAYMRSGPLSYVVNLAVTTKRNGRVVHGYQIGVVPMLWQNSAARYSLRTESSPARGEVTPGRYQVIVSRVGTEIRRDTYRIGLLGRSSESIEISVP